MKPEKSIGELAVWGVFAAVMAFLGLTNIASLWPESPRTWVAPIAILCGLWAIYPSPRKKVELYLYAAISGGCFFAIASLFLAWILMFSKVPALQTLTSEYVSASFLGGMIIGLVAPLYDDLHQLRKQQ